MYTNNLLTREIETKIEFPPYWAHDWGEDQYGIWASFSLEGSWRDHEKYKEKIIIVEQQMRCIPSGTFMMESPTGEGGRYDDEHLHEITIPSGFWLADTPVTQELYHIVTGNNPSQFKSFQKRPVERVSWNDCQEFINKLNKKYNGLNLELPTEEQWEYACRAGGSSSYYWGDESSRIDDHVWYEKNSERRTHEVKGKLPNAYGLYDMLGNVWEWCKNIWYDQHRPYSEKEHEDKSGVFRVLRGGSWYSHAQAVRCAFRNRFDPGFRDNHVGFRLARGH